ncbi:MAG: amidohydrolase family protein [Candidatus Acidiferrales bacterium]
MIRRRFLPLVLIFAFAAIASLARNPMPRTPLSSVAQSGPGPADLVLVNGKIYTMDAAHPWAASVAIRGESIVAVEPAGADLKSWLGPNTRVIDLHGQFAMPGFNDAHTHMAGAGQARLVVNFEGARSLAEFQQRIRDRLKDYKPGEWITGRGWDHTLWPGQKFPTRQDLDAVSTNFAMFFGRVDGHVAVANSRALEIAGVTHATPDPPGGHIERDPKTGEPTGMLEEDSAMGLVYGHVPPFSQSQRRRALELAIDEAASFGVTSVQDCSVQSLRDSDNMGWNNFLVLQELKREGKLKIRVTEWLPFFAPLARLEEMRRAGGASDPWLKTGALKAYLDGSLGSRTAALLAPYSDDPGTSGILRMDPAQVTQMSIERDRAGFQIAFHAIGDRANRIALDAFAAVAKANGARDRRDRVEHAQIITQSDISRFASLGVIPSMQPSHLLDDERWAGHRLGPERLKGAYAWQSLEKSGARLAFGTDYPVESINPLRGIYACVTRELPEGGPAGGWQPQERLPRADCLRAYTVGSAFAEFEEKRKGTIAAGMLADIVVFQDDISEIPAPDMMKTRVAMTIAGGRIVYEQPQP